MAYVYIENSYPVSDLFEKFLAWFTVPAGSELRVYFGLYASESAGWQYFSGDMSHNLLSGNRLVNRGGNEATAQSAYLDAEQYLDSNNRLVAMLPAIYVARRLRVYIETSWSVTLNEWIPGKRLNGGELVRGTIEITDKYTTPPTITVTASNVDYAKLGKLNATEFGMYGYSSTATVLEISNFNTKLSGLWELEASLNASGLSIRADTANVIAGAGNYISEMNGAHPTYRLWVGNASPTAAPFRVTKDGKVYMDDSVILGSVPDLDDDYITATMLGPDSVNSTALMDGVVKDSHLSSDSFNFDANITVASTVTTDTLKLGSNNKIYLGTNNAAELYSTGSNLIINSLVDDIILNAGGAAATVLRLTDDRQSKLYGSLDLTSSLTFGTQLTINEDIIENNASLSIFTATSNDGDIVIYPKHKGGIRARHTGGVILYHNNEPKVETTATNVSLYGRVDVSGTIFSENIEANRIKITSPNGTLWGISITNTGTLLTTRLSCEEVTYLDAVIEEPPLLELYTFMNAVLFPQYSAHTYIDVILTD